MYRVFLLGCVVVMVLLVVEMVLTAIRDAKVCKGSCNQGRSACDCEKEEN